MHCCKSVDLKRAKTLRSGSLGTDKLHADSGIVRCNQSHVRSARSLLSERSDSDRFGVLSIHECNKLQELRTEGAVQQAL